MRLFGVSKASSPPKRAMSEIPLDRIRKDNKPDEPQQASASSPDLPSPSSSTDQNSFDPGSPRHGFSPVRHIASKYRIRKERGKKGEYEPVLSDEEDAENSDTYFVDEETLISQQPRRQGRRWLVCGMVGGFTVLGILLVLNLLLLLSRTAYADEEDPDEIFGNWGRPGSGTEGLAWYPTDFLRDVQPIPVHSHNDYWRKVPLFSAIHVGCIGIESDVWLINDDLLVGHDTAALQPNRTFRSLYVNPLVDLLNRSNPTTEFYNETRRGIFDTNPEQTVILLVDVKTEGAATFRKVLEQLEPLRSKGWLSTFDHGNVKYGPITVVGTGNTPFDVLMENTTHRDAFFDAPLDKLENSNYDSTNSYYSSVSFGAALGKVWFGGLRPGQMRKMRKQLQEAHDRGLKARYWDLPAWPINVRNRVWDTLVNEGIDLLNVDDLKGAAKRDWSKSSWV